jgi:hypothetical protein
MSRKRLDHELNKRRDRLLPPPEVKEKLLARCEEAENNPNSISHKLNAYVEQLGDEERRKMFAGIYEMAFDVYEKEYLAGDTQALMKCMDFCCTKKLVIPNWAAEAFSEGYTKVSNHEARSWDTVFGKPHKGKHLNEQRCDEDKQLIHKCVRELINQGDPIDEGLFEKVGKRFRSQGREIRDIYYEKEHQRIEQLHSLYEGAEIVDKALKEIRQNKSQKQPK